MYEQKSARAKSLILLGRSKMLRDILESFIPEGHEVAHANDGKWRAGQPELYAEITEIVLTGERFLAELHVMESYLLEASGCNGLTALHPQPPRSSWMSDPVVAVPLNTPTPHASPAARSTPSSGRARGA